MATLKGQTIAASYQDLVKRADTYSQTGTNIEIMNDSAVVQPTGLYLESGATTDNVGIGVADPDATLEILDTTTQLKLSYDATNYATFNIAADGLLTITTVDPDGAEADIILAPDGNVGIGTAAPNTLLHLSTTGGTQLRLTAAADNYAYLEFGDTGDEDIGRVQYSNIDNHMAFHTNASEAMRIDSSGNVGIGASTLPWQSGWTDLRLGGNTHITSITATQANSAFYLVHNAQKDTDSSFEYISTDEATSYSQGDGRHIFAYAGSGEATTDITFINSFTLDNDGDVKVLVGDLIFGTAGKGICLGVTSNTDANTLDDYEEGTWTAIIQDASSNTLSFSTNTCGYIKVGKLVFISGRLVCDNLDGASSAVSITNLPFATKATDDGTSAISIGYLSGMGIEADTTVVIRPSSNSNLASFWVWDGSDSDNVTGLTASEFSANGQVQFGGTYQSAA